LIPLAKSKASKGVQKWIHLVEQVEREFRDPPAFGVISSQSYVGLHPEHYPEFRQEFLGKTNRPCSVLLTCTCQQYMCNSIAARIVIDSKVVIWSEIKSPFLSEGLSHWVTIPDAEEVFGYPVDYSSLGPFVFDHSQYMAALNLLG
jgi:hypothetical protein